MRRKLLFSVAILFIIITPRVAFAEEVATTPPAGLDHTTAKPEDCRICHDCAEPSHENLCLKPCNRPKSPSIEATQSVADIVIIDKLSNLYGPVVFPHKKHASMETMSDGCVVCHHHNSNGAPTACDKCHGAENNPDNLRQPGLRGAYHRQCLSCHQDWSHDADCEICHVKRAPGETIQVSPESTDLMSRIHPNVSVPEKWTYQTPEQDKGAMATFRHKEHIDVFGLKCMDCHAKESCNRCHDSGKSGEKHVRQDPHEDCQKCHDTSDNCNQCHAQEEIPPFNHKARSGFEIKPYHQNTACAQCHPENKFKGIKRDCQSCHAKDWFPASFDHVKGGLILNKDHIDTPCAGCHGDGFGKPSRCNTCHDDKRKFPFKMPGSKPDDKANKTKETPQ